MKPKIIIEFRLNPWKESRFIEFNVDEFLLSEAAAPIDFPSPEALASGSFADTLIVNHICTPPEEIARRLKARQAVSDLLRSRITGAIYEYLERGDKQMGYPKNSRVPTSAPAEKP